jgi:release factor glutamine methyltransferase
LSPGPASRLGTPARDALAAAADGLRAAGVESPRLDAELLLAEATGWDRARLAAEPEAPVEPAAARAYAAMVRRRLRREPLAYVVGHKGFRDIELFVDPRVLVPRPETELLVELALERDPKSVLDVGTGSGAVALAIADELPRAELAATDTSPDALEVARDNARGLGLADRVSFSGGAGAPGRRFDLVVANLPYVREAEWATLAPEITDHEPRGALVAGDDGLDAIRGFLDSPPDCGAIGLEVGAGQAGEVAELVAAAGFGGVETRRDLAGIERVVFGTR